MKFTETEIEFKGLHQKLLNLQLYDLASNFSSAFYKYGHENYKKGANMILELNKQ